MNEIQDKLSADPGASVLGIIALLISLVGCCCGILAIPAVVMSIIGLIWAIRSSNTYKTNPEIYSPKSFSNVKTAKILNIIALVLSSIFVIASLVFFGNFMADPEEFFKKLENGEFIETETNTYEYETGEKTNQEVDTWQYEEEVDSVDYNTESIETESELNDTIQN